MDKRVLVMDISVFPAAIVHDILGHSNFRPVENRRFVHIVPQPDIVGGALEVLQAVKLLVVVSSCWVVEVEVR